MAEETPVVLESFTSASGSSDLNFEAASTEVRSGFKRVHIILGEKDDPNAPHVYWSHDPAGVTWDAQSHHTDFVMSYLQGSQKVGDKWYHAGDARIVKAGTVYGPMETGPEGMTAILVFAQANAKPIFADDAPDEKESPYFRHAHTNEQ
jgi:hypothetical protein